MAKPRARSSRPPHHNFREDSRSPVLHLHPRRPQGSGRHGPQDRQLRLAHPRLVDVAQAVHRRIRLRTIRDRMLPGRGRRDIEKLGRSQPRRVPPRNLRPLHRQVLGGQRGDHEDKVESSKTPHRQGESARGSPARPARICVPATVEIWPAAKGNIGEAVGSSPQSIGERAPSPCGRSHRWGGQVRTSRHSWRRLRRCRR